MPGRLCVSRAITHEACLRCSSRPRLRADLAGLHRTAPERSLSSIPRLRNLPTSLGVLSQRESACSGWDGRWNTFWSTMEQQHVPEEALGRVDSVAWTGSILIMPVAYAIAGPLADGVGVRETLLGAAAIGVACNVGALLSRSVRELERLDDTAVTSPAASSDPGYEPGPAPASRAP